MSPKDREALRMMFGGRCAYCGCELTGKWHADHVEPLDRVTEPVLSGSGHGYETTKAGYTKYRSTGRYLSPHNHRKDNLFPSCVRCNILKSNSNIEGFRSMLAYFAESIPRIAGYSHVHHLMRFGKLTIETDPVIFWFERYRASFFTPPTVTPPHRATGNGALAVEGACQDDHS